MSVKQHTSVSPTTAMPQSCFALQLSQAKACLKLKLTPFVSNCSAKTPKAWQTNSLPEHIVAKVKVWSERFSSPRSSGEAQSKQSHAYHGRQKHALLTT